TTGWRAKGGRPRGRHAALPRRLRRGERSYGFQQLPHPHWSRGPWRTVWAQSQPGHLRRVPMTHEQRITRIAAFGFTEPQAAFLVEAMLDSGFFLGRQYCSFARIARGQKLVDFLDKLTTRKFATPYRCGHNKARVFHVHHTALYEAIEQRDVRFRKRMAVGRAVERLMILDHVIAHRELRWLGAETDKVAHFLTTTCLERDSLPRLVFGDPPNVTVSPF